MGYAVAQQTNGKATAALVCGLVSFACGGFFVSIPAIILGRIAQNEIRASGGRQGGEGMAKAGFILGIINVVLSVIFVAFYIVVIVAASNSSSNSTYSNYIRTLLAFG